MLGIGGVGGTVAARLGNAGADVVAVARPETCAVLQERGLRFEHRGLDLGLAENLTVATHLVEPVDLLVVAVKTPALEEALERISPRAVEEAVVLPLLNGLEHLETIRARLGRRVAAGSISRFEAYRDGLARVVQTTPSGVVTMASEDVSRARLEQVASWLRLGELEARVWESEEAVLWDKAARLAVLAAATALTQRPVGELRADSEWRPLLERAIAEACAVAAADGVTLEVAAQWAIIDAMPETLTTSTSRDVAEGNPSELDAIAGAVVRAGTRLGVPCPTLAELVERCLAP